MNKRLIAILFLSAGVVMAQQPAESPAAKPRSSPAAKSTDAGKKAPTEITAEKEATFDEKAHVAIFLGAVRIVDPQFTLTADKVTAFLKKETGAAAPGATAKPSLNEKAAPSPNEKKPAPNENSKTAVSSAANSNEKGGGLERAVAEGNVLIVQDKPDPSGGPPEHYVGKGARADYDAKTGDIVLTGWPQVQQGINSHVATEASTVMTLNRSGTIKTEGKSKTVIEDSSRDSNR